VALAAALARVMAEFKRKAEVAKTPGDMWDVEDYLRQQRRRRPRYLARQTHLLYNAL
jgi:hypothetical protein